MAGFGRPIPGFGRPIPGFGRPLLVADRGGHVARGAPLCPLPAQGQAAAYPPVERAERGSGRRLHQRSGGTGDQGCSEDSWMDRSPAAGVRAAGQVGGVGSLPLSRCATAPPRGGAIGSGCSGRDCGLADFGSWTGALRLAVAASVVGGPPLSLRDISPRRAGGEGIRLPQRIPGRTLQRTAYRPAPSSPPGQQSVPGSGHRAPHASAGITLDRIHDPSQHPPNPPRWRACRPPSRPAPGARRRTRPRRLPARSRACR